MKFTPSFGCTTSEEPRLGWVLPCDTCYWTGIVIAVVLYTPNSFLVELYLVSFCDFSTCDPERMNEKAK